MHLRFIYTDEAGTSAKEPVVVMVGLVVNADLQLRPAERLVQEVCAEVPEQFRNGFISHATSVWNDKKYRPEWSREKRFEFLCHMMSIPRIIKMGVAWAAADKREEGSFPPLQGYTRDQTLHTGTFGFCIANADRFIRHFFPGEVAALIAEDLPEMRTALRQRIQLLRSNRHIIRPDQLNSYAYGKAATTMPSAKFFEYTISQVVNEVLFVGKNGASLLQVADACAFGMRRYFAGLSQGKEFAQAILGKDHFLPSLQPGLLHNGMFFS